LFLGCIVQGLGFRAWGIGFRAQGHVRREGKECRGGGAGWGGGGRGRERNRKGDIDRDNGKETAREVSERRETYRHTHLLGNVGAFMT